MILVIVLNDSVIRRPISYDSVIIELVISDHNDIPDDTVILGLTHW